MLDVIWLKSIITKSKTVEILKSEFEESFGIKRMRNEIFIQKMDNLMSTIKIYDENGELRLSPFSETFTYKDEYEQLIVRATFTDSFIEKIMSKYELKYMHYRCYNTSKFHSKYSYIMFTYLTSVERKRAWTIKINDLRDILGCYEDSYAEYKRFNSKVLKMVQNDITELTSCRYTYEPIKRGRSYYEIKFKILSR